MYKATQPLLGLFKLDNPQLDSMRWGVNIKVDPSVTEVGEYEVGE